MNNRCLKPIWAVDLERTVLLLSSKTLTIRCLMKSVELRWALHYMRQN